MGDGARLGMMRMEVVVLVVVVAVMTMMTPSTRAEITGVRLQNGTQKDRWVSGRVQLMDTEVGVWNTLCYDHDDEDEAMAICGMLGFQRGMIVGNGFYGNGTDPMYGKRFFCGVNLESLEDCNVGPWLANTQCTALGIVCFNKTRDALQVRQVNGKQSPGAGKIRIGLLEARTGDLPWGPVCHDKFSLFDTNADHACQLMGLKFGEIAMASSEAQPTPSPTTHYQLSKDFDCEDCWLKVSLTRSCIPSELTELRCVNASVRLQTTHRDVLDAGRVEIHTEGHGWSPVCDTNWTSHEAYTVCKELGFADATPLKGNALGGSEWESTVTGTTITGLNCPLNTQKLVNCTRHTLGSRICPGSKASVLCFQFPRDQTDQTFTTGLTHGTLDTTSRGWGQVQVRYKGFWGAVCPNSFTDKEATVACKSITGHNYNYGVVQGYGTAALRYKDDSWSWKTQFRAQKPVWISSLSCLGNETSLEHCSVSQWGPPSVLTCSQNAYVVCYGTELKITLSDQHSGVLRVMRDQSLGKVCGHNFGDFDADIACTSLGYFGGKLLQGETGQAVSGPAYMSNVKCHQSDTSLFQCDSPWEDSAVTCDTRADQAAVSCFNDIELRFGTDALSGVVIMYDRSTRRELGKICSATFGDMDAKVICTQLGFANGKALPAGAYGLAGAQTSTLAASLTGVQCLGSESSIWDCPRSNSTPQYWCSAFSSNYSSVSCYNTLVDQEDRYLVYGGDQAGRVLVQDLQTTGYICPTYWTDQAANVLCKEVGNNIGGVSYSFADVVHGPFFVTNISCTGSEISLSGCSSQQGLCQASTAAGVLCYQSQAPTFNLVSEGKAAGRGRVSITVDGVDGRVCGHNFTDRDAKVFCISVGYKEGYALKFTRSSQDVVMWDVDCAGSERSLFQCGNAGWKARPSSSCSGPGDTEAGVMCFKDVKLSEGQYTRDTVSGTLQLRISSSGSNQWAPVCSNSNFTSTEARVACSQLGFNGSAFLSPVAGPWRLRYAVQCTGSEAYLANCTRTPSSCYYLARVLCYSSSGDTGWQWEIRNTSFGEVTVTHQGLKGAVCRTGWDNKAAGALCRQKGFMGGVTFRVDPPLTTPTPSTSSSDLPAQLTWLEDVTCPEGASGMTQCTRNVSVSLPCRNPQDMASGVLCYRKSAPKVALADGADKYQGRIVINYDGVNGTVCDVGWSANDARQVCSQLGFAPGRKLSGSYFGGGGGPVYLSGLRCEPLREGGAPGNILHCGNSGWKVAPVECLDHSRDAGVVCNPKVKLAINSSYGPVLQVVNYSYKLVCATGFDDNAARVVCRQHGFATGKALYPGAFGSRPETIGVSGVSCAGSETTFDQCEMTLGPGQSCSYTSSSSSSSFYVYVNNNLYASAVCSDDGGQAYKVKLKQGDHGFVVVSYFSHDGYVCAEDYDDKDALVLCKEAGYLTGFAYLSDDQSSEDDIRWLTKLNCTGSETRVDQCRQGNASLALGKMAAKADCPKASAFCSNFQHTVSWRVTKNGREESNKGRVEVRVNGTWGSVCAQNFEQSEVAVVCRKLGYESGSVITQVFGKNRSPVWVTYLNCSGHEDDPLKCNLRLGDHKNLCVTNDISIVCNSGVRLRQEKTGAVLNYGLLEVKNQTDQDRWQSEVWSAVCAASFTNHTASIMCKDLGYNGGFYQNYTTAWRYMGLGSAVITCSAGTTQYLGCQMTMNATGFCPDNAYVYLFCSETWPPDEDLTVILNGYTGPVNVSRYGFHGAVCGDSFDDKEAQVVCKEEGFGGGFRLKAYRSSIDPLVLSQLSCAGGESRLSQCSRGQFVTSMPDCPSKSSAHILCTQTADKIEYRVNNPAGGMSGRAEVRIGGVWKLVDGHGFTYREARVFCRSVGYHTGYTSYRRPTGLETLSYAVGRLYCLGNETDLRQCSGDWGLEGRNNQAAMNAYVSCQKSVRLMKGTGTSNGMVEFNSNSNRWGPVCQEDFDNKDAQVVCRELGFNSGISYTCCNPHGRTWRYHTMAKVECTGQETSLDDCPHSQNSSDTRQCSRYTYASVACFNTTDTQDYNITMDDSGNDSGPLVLTYVGSKGRICSDDWDDDDARVACRELGYPNGEAYFHYRYSRYYYYGYVGPYWASQFNCSGTEARLQDCDHVGVGKVTECNNYHMAGVLCFQTLGMAYRMTGSDNSTNSGRVEIRIAGEWGTVCSRTFRTVSAKVFCRSQGFVDGVPKDLPAGLPSAMGMTIYEASLRCLGTEDSLSQCPHLGWEPVGTYDYSCNSHTNDAAVFCYANVKLSTGIDATHGAVRLYQNDTWNFISDEDFDDLTAAEVCRELGFTDGRAVCCSAYTGSRYWNYARTDTSLALHCDGTESDLSECVFQGEYFSRTYPSVICRKGNEPFNDTDYEIDFENHDDTTMYADSGRLHVTYLGIKGRICSLGWTDAEAQVFCRSKGYTSGFAYMHSDKNVYLRHDEIGPFLMSEFRCTGNETNLMDCLHRGRLNMGNCTNGHSAGAACYRSAYVKYRMVGGTNNSGRVEMALDNVWGTVCNQDWDDKDANVFCRSLHFNGGEAVPVADFGSGTGTMWLKDVQCQGTEEALHQCPHDGFFEDLEESWSWWSWGCANHDNDAAALCFKDVKLFGASPDKGIGGLQVYYENQWVLVCDDDFDNNAATTACKGLYKDYQYGLAIKGSAYDVSDAPMLIQSVTCGENETDFANCTITRMGTCASGYYASVACSKDPFVAEGFQVRLTNDTYSGPAWGILEINEHGLWQRICHQGWDETDASVACRQLGFKGGVSYTHIILHERPVAYRNFTCIGTESSLEQCPYLTTPDLQNCAFSHFDAGALCYNSTGVSYSMGGGNKTVGRVQIHYDGLVGAVCERYWSRNDSKVFCRSLDSGFQDGLPVDRSDVVQPPRSLRRYFIDAPVCRGHEPTLLDCLTSGFNSTYRGYRCYREAFVQCFDVPLKITNITLKLDNGETGVDRGRLEVFVSGVNEWGTVCDDYWDDFDASVACVQLGFKWGVENNTFGRGTGRIWLDNVECKGSETHLDECIHRGYGEHNCWHGEDAGVVCYNTPKPTLPPTTTLRPTTPRPTTPRPTTPTTTTQKPTATTTQKPTATTTQKPTATTTQKPIATTTQKPTTPTPEPTTTTTPEPTPSTTTPITSTTPEPTTTRKPAVSEEQKMNTVPIAVGVSVGLLILILLVVVVVVVVIIKRRKAAASHPHQRFSDDVLSGSADGSIAMHNKMYDANMEEMADKGEITLGGDQALYTPGQQPAAGGFTNPVYSVMQPFKAEGSSLSEKNGRPGGDSKEV